MSEPSELREIHKKLDSLGDRMSGMETLMGRLDERSVADLRAQESFRVLTKEALARLEDTSVRRAEYKSDTNATNARLEALEDENELRRKEARQNRNLVLGGLLFPIVTAVVAALIIAVIVSH